MTPPNARENDINSMGLSIQAESLDTKDLVERLNDHFKRHPSHVYLAKWFLQFLAMDSLSPTVCQAIDLLTHVIILKHGIEAVEKGYRGSTELENNHQQRETRTQQGGGDDHAIHIVKNRGRSQRLNDEQVATMFKMFDEGKDKFNIANHFDVTIQTVNYRRKQWSGIIPRSKKRRQKTTLSFNQKSTLMNSKKIWVKLE
jgi:hypothetical protein